MPKSSKRLKAQSALRRRQFHQLTPEGADQIREFVAQPEEWQLLFVGVLTADEATRLACNLVHYSALMPDDVSVKVLSRLLEISDPASYSEAAQSLRDRLAVTPKRLAAIRAERDDYGLESPQEREARDNAADAEAVRLKKAAFRKIKPFLNLSASAVETALASCSATKLDDLLASVSRCLWDIDLDQLWDKQTPLQHLLRRIHEAKFKPSLLTPCHV